MTDQMLDWTTPSCTLPTAEQPLRLAEFQRLFATSLRAQGRPSETRLRWRLDPASETTVRDLTVRESSCCSFFTFTITPSDGDLLVDVDVPTAHVTVLDALQAHAAAGMV
jgi:hypothetical protein